MGLNDCVHIFNIYIYYMHTYILVRGWGFDSRLFGVALTLYASFHILVGDEVQSSRIQAYSPRAPVVVYRVATPIMPNGHMRSCPGRVAPRFSVWRAERP